MWFDYGSVFGPTLQECALRDAVWRKARLRHEVFLWGGWLSNNLHWRLLCFSCSIHTAGVCITSRSVAKQRKSHPISYREVASEKPSLNEIVTLFMCHPCHLICGVSNSSALTNLGNWGSTRSDPHCWRVRHESQCGESLVPSPRSLP